MLTEAVPLPCVLLPPLLQIDCSFFGLLVPESSVPAVTVKAKSLINIGWFRCLVPTCVPYFFFNVKERH
ncbi:hypothetical protein K1719_021214 [Acacia pycnantha]|nr:hypothetical protein K1719_021214 [Acacia pycnantha]